jgi:G3E family GTPase
VGSDPTRELAWQSLLETLGPAPIPAQVSKLAGSAADGARDTSPSPVPVTLLSGFLGSGKTTLLTRLLTETQLRIVAVVNDVAALNVDAQFVRARSSDTIELANGCACCSLGAQLLQELETLVVPKGQADEPPDAILIEASGVADPTGIAQTIANAQGVMLDGIVTLVDGLQFQQWLLNPVTAHLCERQLAAAHMVVVTKLDEAGAPEFQVLRHQLEQRVPGRVVLDARSLLARVNPVGLDDLLLGAGLRGARPAPVTTPPDDAWLGTETLDFIEPLEMSELCSLLDELPPEVLRIKGWVRLQGQQGCWYEIQAAGPRWRVIPLNPRVQQGFADDVPAAGQLVVIGEAYSKNLITFTGRLASL